MLSCLSWSLRFDSSRFMGSPFGCRRNRRASRQVACRRSRGPTDENPASARSAPVTDSRAAGRHGDRAGDSAWPAPQEPARSCRGQKRSAARVQRTALHCKTVRLVVIVGPTGAGKTRLAMQLAALTGGEVVSADSQQVYAGMDIGTGKVSAEERARVPHHVIDVVTPDEEMTAQRFVELADRAIADAAARAKPVIVCGGTGLYVRALLLGLFAGPPASPELRAELTELARREGCAALRSEERRV